MSVIDKLNMMNDFDFDKVNEEYARNQAKSTTRSDAVLSLARCLNEVINSVVAQYNLMTPTERLSYLSILTMRLNSS